MTLYQDTTTVTATRPELQSIPDRRTASYRDAHRPRRLTTNIACGGQPTIGEHGGPRQPSARSPEASAFVTDTWVFFADPHAGWTGEDRWGLGFGPTDIQRPQWSLFHCVTENRFDGRSICPELNPSHHDLLRWTTSVVGPATATLLLESVGSCLDFYRQYFAERPDLRGRVGQ
jgi:hypothetical protein